MRFHALAIAALLHLDPSWAAKAHQHGEVQMDLGIDKQEVTVALTLPLDSLVGFERAPRTADERKAAAAALARLRDAHGLFRFAGTSGCQPQRADVSAPMLETPRSPGGDPGDGHSDAEAQYVFSCDDTSRLRRIDVLLHQAFPKVERVTVQMALPQQQRRAVLRRPHTAIDLPR